jgi:hypothetical protein
MSGRYYKQIFNKEKGINGIRLTNAWLLHIRPWIDTIPRLRCDKKEIIEWCNVEITPEIAEICLDLVLCIRDNVPRIIEEYGQKQLPESLCFCKKIDTLLEHVANNRHIRKNTWLALHELDQLLNSKK